MSDSYHLVRRKGVYYYNRRVPEEAVAAVGRAVIRYSLNTTDKKVAKQRREAEDLKWSAQFQALSASAPCSASPSGLEEAPSYPGPLTGPAAIRLVQQYVERMDQQFAAGERRPSNTEQSREVEIDLEMGIQMLRRADDPDGDERVSHAWEHLLGRQGFRLDEGSLSRDQFHELVRRALLELDRRSLGRLKDERDRTYFDALFSPSSMRQVSFGELADQFLVLKHEEAKANGTSQKHLERLQASVSLISEIVGAGTAVEEISYDTCLRVRSLLARIPANRTKLYKNLPLEQAIARAESEARGALSPVSQDRYLGALRDLLDLALRKALIQSNPAEGMRPLKRDELAAGEKRMPFTPDQLQRLFRGHIYARCVGTNEAPYRSAEKPWQFWLPLICLFTGMRPNEVCQLQTGDVRRTEHGTWYISIEASADHADEPGVPPKKSLKTPSSKRRVPVHPELQAVGFLEFVAQRHAVLPGGRLFPDLKPNKHGNVAWYAVKQFNNAILPKAFTIKPRQSFYSLRHSWRDALRRINRCVTSHPECTRMEPG